MQVAKKRRLDSGLARAAGAVARYGLRRALPLSMRAGMKVGKFAYQMYNRYRSGKKKSKAPKYVTRGRYSGRFKKRKLTKSKNDVYNRHGFVNVTEVNGTVSDPDCVYVGHSTMSGDRLLTLFLQATLRKLFKQFAGWNCTSVHEPIRGYEGFGDGWKLILVLKDVQTGVITESGYETTTTDSIYRIVGDTAGGVTPAWANLYNFWVNYIGASTITQSGSVQQPTRLMLYRKEVNVTSFWQFAGELYFPNEVIHYCAVSELKVQNRTLSAGGSSSTEDVSNNPIAGKLYSFNTSVPRARVEGINIIEGAVDSTGVITKRAAEFPIGTVGTRMNEPPDAKVFRNCTKAANILLQPGDIKKDVIVHKKRLPVYEFWERLDWRKNTGTVATAVQMKAEGRCSLIALEDMINVNAAQNISVAYECNRTQMMYLSTVKNQMAQGAFFAQTQSSVPA